MASDHVNLAIVFFVLISAGAIAISAIALVWYKALGESFERIIADAIARFISMFRQNDE